MSKTNWTPGPWHATTYNLGKFDVTAKIEGSSWSGTLCTRSPWKGDAKQSKANAHLISAAPDLYEALEALLEAHGLAYRSTTDMDEAINEAELEAIKALAKARGES